MNQGTNFLRGSFSNRHNVRVPIQFRRENTPTILKDYFYSRIEPSIFTSVAPDLLNGLKETSLVFPALKSTNHLLPQSSMSHSSDSSSEAISSC